MIISKVAGAVLLSAAVIALLLAIQSIASLFDPALQNASAHFGGVAALFFSLVAVLTAVPGLVLVCRRNKGQGG